MSQWIQYEYDAGNKRILEVSWTGSGGGGWTKAGDNVHFYGITGQRLGTYSVLVSNEGLPTVSLSFSTGVDSVWFGGRLVQKGGTSVAAPDRLGSIGRYLPYGEERTGQSGNPANGNEKFATYTRDGVTGLDYADQRWYAQGQGRFLTSDPYQASAGAGDPASWNRYAYVRGDPVGRVDPQGLADFEVTVWGLSGTTAAMGPTPSSFNIGTGAELLMDGAGSVLRFTSVSDTVGGSWTSLFITVQIRELARQNVEEWVRRFVGANMSPQCRDFLFQRLGVTLEQIQGAVAAANLVDSTTVTSPYGTAILPRPQDSNYAAVNQAIADSVVGHTGATLAEYQLAVPGTVAWGQYGGNTIFYNPFYFSQIGSAVGFFTLMHEGLHLLGFSDRYIQQNIGTTVGASSNNITLGLIKECGF
jgi:RHS repeat-associated protein